MTLSRVCHAVQGQPNDRHVPCTGCSCTCHHVVRPDDFRAQVEASKARIAREEETA